MAPGSERLTAGIAWTGIVLLALLIVVGGVVTASASGLGCGAQWPTCQGQLLPPGGIHPTLEWSHRVLAAVTGMVIAAYAGVVFVRRRSRLLVGLAVASLLLLALQALLGEQTVLLGLPSWVVATHDAVALLLLESLLAGAIVAGRGDRRLPAGVLVWAPAAISVGVVFMGSDLAHLDVACTGLSGCVGALVGGSDVVGLPAVAHWALAAALFVTGIWAIDRMPQDQPARFWLVVGLALLTLQAALGVLLLVTGLSPAILAVHEPIGLFTGAAFFVAAAEASLAGKGHSFEPLPAGMKAERPRT